MAGLTAAESFLRSILTLLSSKFKKGSVTKTQSLTGTATPLADTRDCKEVILLSNVTVLTGSGENVSLTAPITLPCQKPSDILVSGSGTLSYIILV